MLVATVGEYVVHGMHDFWFWVMWILSSGSTLTGTIALPILVRRWQRPLPRVIVVGSAFGGAALGAFVGIPVTVALVCGLLTECVWP